ncbi:MAG: DNA polymerase III subunit [Prevotellaceae bacterium]|nr:DNA polymerase III subunit [Prevotellaceae bacterium]
MTFDEIVGQEPIKRRLQASFASGEIPHALLFAGPEGTGKLPTAIAFAQLLLCQHPEADGKPCGHCTGCAMSFKLEHPDLHLSFPVYKPNGQTTPPVCQPFMPEFRSLVLESPYISVDEWRNRIKTDNKQLFISVGEAEEILTRLSIKPQQGGRKISIIWLPELMREEAANHLLKFLEEPTPQTIFILVSNVPEKLLETIRSRTQRIDFPPLTPAEISVALQKRSGLSPEDANAIAQTSGGNYTAAQAALRADAVSAQNLDMFKLLMRNAYKRDLRELRSWADNMARLGREEQKGFLLYCIKMVRENFVYNFRHPELCHMTAEETDFARNFARFINENNVIPIRDEIETALRDIEQNTASAMVFYDFALQIIVLLVQK